MRNDRTGQTIIASNRAGRAGILAPISLHGKWLSDADEVLSYLTNADARIAALEEAALIDTLTGLYNRKGFMNALSKELGHVERELSDGGLLIMIDIDNFKTIESRHGRNAADASLRVVGSSLSSDIRTTDSAARLEDDCFVLLFVNTTRKEALERAQFLIKRLNNLSFIWNGEEIPLRASLGLKEYRRGNTAESLISAVDASLQANHKQLNHTPIRQNNKRVPFHQRDIQKDT